MRRLNEQNDPDECHDPADSEKQNDIIQLRKATVRVSEVIAAPIEVDWLSGY